jgi:hypothetical protein
LFPCDTSPERENGRFAPKADVTARCAFIFGGHEVSIGFSGRCDAIGAAWEATALTGKRSLRLAAELKLLHRTDRSAPNRSKRPACAVHGRTCFESRHKSFERQTLR